MRYALLFFVLLGSSAWAAETITIDKAEPFDAELVAASNPSGLPLRIDGEQTTIAWNQLIRWGTPAKPLGRPRVVLRDGSVLVAAPPWTRDGSIQLDKQRIKIRSSSLRAITADRSLLKSLLFEAARDPQIYHRPKEPPNDLRDEVYTVNGDVLKVVQSTIERSELRIKTSSDSEPIPLDLKQVASLHSWQEGTKRREGAMLVGLRDGSLLRSLSLSFDERGFSTELRGGIKLSGRKVSDIVFLQRLQGIFYLSDIKPIDYRHTPYAGVAWDYARDENLHGEPIHVAGQRYLKGIAMHSPSRLVYRLKPGTYNRLHFAMAIDDSAQTSGPSIGGSVVFRVLIAKEKTFQPVFTSPVVRSGDPPRTASVDIKNARAMALLVEPADYGDRQDHAVWLDARLSRLSIDE